MVSLETIEEKVELGRAYYLDLIAYDYESVINGYCSQYTSKITCLNRLIRALTWDIQGDYNTAVTQRLYEMLMNTISTYSGAVLSNDPNVVIPGQTTIIIIEPGDIMQTDVVFPTTGDSTYTFAELIGQEVLSVYRSTGTVLRAHSTAPDNEFVQFNSSTGMLTFLNPFSPSESLWAEYKTT